MFNFIFLNNYKAKLLFCIFVFIITNCSLLQANTANNSYNIYKNKIYTNFSYININSNISIMLYGVGMETKLSNSTEILCNYATGNLQLNKIKKRKSTDKPQVIMSNLKQYYNDFVLQYDFTYAHMPLAFKKIENKISYNYTLSINTTFFAINLGKKFAINDNVYLLPKCSVGFDMVETKIKRTYVTNSEKCSSTSHGFIIIPELVVVGDLFLTNIKINSEISFSYLFDTNDLTNNKFNMKAKIILYIDRFYVATEAKSITESHGRSFLIKLGVLF